MRIGLVQFTGGGPGPGDDTDLAAFDGLADALADSGHEVSLIMRRHDSRRPDPVEANVEYRKLVAGPPKRLSESEVFEHVGVFIRKLNREVVEGGYDVVHSHGWLGGLATQLAVPAGTAAVVHTFHQSRLAAGPGSDPGALSRLRVERGCAGRADHLITTSSAERDALAQWGVERRRMTVIPPGVPSGVGATGVPEQRGARIVGFGSPSRLADLVRMLSGLPSVELAVCNSAALPASEAARLPELATRLGVAQRLRLVEGFSPSARASVLSGARLAVILGRPGAGTEHLEAMALGVPVVAGDPAVADAVVDGITGVHAQDATPRELAKLVRELLASRITCQQMSVAARDRAATRYRWPRIAAETLRVYESLVAHDTEDAFDYS